MPVKLHSSLSFPSLFSLYSTSSSFSSSNSTSNSVGAYNHEIIHKNINPTKSNSINSKGEYNQYDERNNLYSSLSSTDKGLQHFISPVRPNQIQIISVKHFQPQFDNKYDHQEKEESIRYEKFEYVSQGRNRISHSFSILTWRRKQRCQLETSINAPNPIKISHIVPDSQYGEYENVCILIFFSSLSPNYLVIASFAALTNDDDTHSNTSRRSESSIDKYSVLLTHRHSEPIIQIHSISVSLKVEDKLKSLYDLNYNSFLFPVGFILVQTITSIYMYQLLENKMTGLLQLYLRTQFSPSHRPITSTFNNMMPTPELSFESSMLDKADMKNWVGVGFTTIEWLMIDEGGEICLEKFNSIKNERIHHSIKNVKQINIKQENLTRSFSMSLLETKEENEEEYKEILILQAEIVFLPHPRSILLLYSYTHAGLDQHPSTQKVISIDIGDSLKYNNDKRQICIKSLTFPTSATPTQIVIPIKSNQVSKTVRNGHGKFHHTISGQRKTKEKTIKTAKKQNQNDSININSIKTLINHNITKSHNILPLASTLKDETDRNINADNTVLLPFMFSVVEVLSLIPLPDRPFHFLLFTRSEVFLFDIRYTNQPIAHQTFKREKSTLINNIHQRYQQLSNISPPVVSKEEIQSMNEYQNTRDYYSFSVCQVKETYFISIYERGAFSALILILEFSSPEVQTQPHQIHRITDNLFTNYSQQLPYFCSIPMKISLLSQPNNIRHQNNSSSLLNHLSSTLSIQSNNGVESLPLEFRLMSYSDFFNNNSKDPISFQTPSKRVLQPNNNNSEKSSIDAAEDYLFGVTEEFVGLLLLQNRSLFVQRFRIMMPQYRNSIHRDIGSSIPSLSTSSSSTALPLPLSCDFTTMVQNIQLLMKSNKSSLLAPLSSSHNDFIRSSYYFDLLTWLRCLPLRTSWEIGCFLNRLVQEDTDMVLQTYCHSDYKVRLKPLRGLDRTSLLEQLFDTLWSNNHVLHIKIKQLIISHHQASDTVFSPCDNFSLLYYSKNELEAEFEEINFPFSSLSFHPKKENHTLLRKSNVEENNLNTETVKENNNKHVLNSPDIRGGGIADLSSNVDALLSILNKGKVKIKHSTDGDDGTNQLCTKVTDNISEDETRTSFIGDINAFDDLIQNWSDQWVDWSYRAKKKEEIHAIDHIINWFYYSGDHKMIQSEASGKSGGTPVDRRFGKSFTVNSFPSDKNRYLTSHSSSPLNMEIYVNEDEDEYQIAVVGEDDGEIEREERDED